MDHSSYLVRTQGVDEVLHVAEHLVDHCKLRGVPAWVLHQRLQKLKKETHKLSLQVGQLALEVCVCGGCRQERSDLCNGTESNTYSILGAQRVQCC